MSAAGGTGGPGGTFGRAARGDAALRDQIVAGCRRMVADGLTRGTSGNISARTAGGMLITPSNVEYATMDAADVVAVSLDGEPRDSAGRRASTEWRMHARIHETRADVKVVVHTHSPYATALACMRRPIPAFHYMVAAAGGRDVPCAPYATFGTVELAATAAAALIDRNACLLANHGVLAVGPSVSAALGLALEIETLAQQYCIALQAGEPVLLSDAQMAEALEAFSDYRS
ncbi:MAG TPA: class II aldolase/adducin family protein [Longimicrobiales bacterium]|nr:class II aldolase/adducin family protein [Longimicrobiales bacterium]